VRYYKNNFGLWSASACGNNRVDMHASRAMHPIDQ
jgi:hypothetical protein